MSSAYSFDALSGTSGTTTVSIGILSSLLLGCVSGAIFLPSEMAVSKHYEVREIAVTPSAANQFYFVDTLTQVDRAVDFEGSVSNFYAKLKSSQETLGQAFEKVLVDNLWDLYSRT